MESKSVKETLLTRRSIRRFEREAITPEQLELIYEAIRNTPTSYNGQQFTVIDVDDQAIKEEPLRYYRAETDQDVQQVHGILHGL